MKKRRIVLEILVTCLLLSVYITAEADQGNGVQDALGIPGMGQETVSGSDASVSSGDANSQDTTKVDTTSQESAYYDALIAHEMKEREYAIYNNQLKAQLISSQTAYLTKLKTELEDKYKIEKAKLDLGYATSVTVAEVQNQYTATELQIQTALEWQELYKDTIVLNGGEYKEVPLVNDLKALERNYYDTFKENSAQLLSYNHQILRAGSAQEVTLLQLQKEQYEINLKIYVEGMQIRYSDVLRRITMLDNEITVIESKINNATALYEKGKIAEIQLKELETELSRQEYERMNSICDGKRIYYILTHTIEGQEIS